MSSLRSAESPNQIQTVKTPDTTLLTLSHDILLMILQHCLPLGGAVEIPPAPQCQRLVLGQICHTLRSLLQSCPIFWIRFSIVKLRATRHEELFEEWVGRAGERRGSLPISIENQEESRFSLHELEELIFPHVTRLFRLHLYLKYDALEGLFTLLPPNAFPHLSDFWVQCTDFQHPSILSVEPLFLKSPLEKFNLIVGPPVHIRGLGVSWGNLKVLRLSVSQARFFFPISWVHVILDACRNSLEACSISLEPTTEPSLPCLVLPHLKSLSLNFRDPGWKTQAGVLGFLVLPSLISFELSSSEGLAFNETCHAFKSFFYHSPDVQRVRFERTPSPGSGVSSIVNSLELITILKLLPNLKSVSLPRGHHTNIVAILEALLFEQICPMLEDMELMVNNGLQVLRVIQVLWKESAQGGGSLGLKAIKMIDPKLSWIGICEPSDKEDPDITHGRRILRELEEEGLRIRT